MAWTVTADHRRFHEAVSWFRSRVVVTEREYAKLSAEAKNLAFTVAGATELAAVQQVYDAMDKAIADGESIDSFRTRVAGKLGKRFAREESAQLTTIFRTNAQAAYHDGRWYQLQNPEVTGALPYRMLDVVLDSRTSPICNRLGRPPTILRHDSPYWLTHWPPFHPRCRTTVRAISAREADKRGIHKPKGKDDIPKGFGLSPPKREAYEPDASRYDARVYRQYKKKQQALRKRPERSATPKRKRP